MPMQASLSEFVQQNRNDLIQFLPETDVDALERVDNSAELKNLLLSNSFYFGDRLIDRLTIKDEDLEGEFSDAEGFGDSDDYSLDEDDSFSGQVEESDVSIEASSSGSSHADSEENLKRTLLELIVQSLDPNDWHKVIKKRKHITDDLIVRYIKNGAEPEWLLGLLTSNLPSNEIKIALLTKSVGDENHADSIVTHTNVPFEKIITIIKDFNDEDKVKIALAPTASNNCLLYRADTEGEVQILIDSIHNDEFKKQLRNQLEIVNLRKRATHFLGIADKGTKFDAATNSTHRARSQNENKVMGFEGFDSREAQSAFVNFLNQYQASDAFLPEMLKIKRAFNNIDYYRSQTSQNNKMTRFYQENDFVIIPSGWPGHTVMVAATDKFLVVGNRGEGLHELGGCIIYRLEKPLTKEDIKVFAEHESQEAVEELIESIVQKDDDIPIIFHAFPLKAQKYGTCAIANRKALVAGLLPLLRELRDDKSKEPEFNDFLLTESNREYKKFTHFTRSSTLSELIEGFQTAPHQHMDLMESLSEYCNQHLDFINASEVKLLHQLIINIPQGEIDRLLDKLSIEAKIIVRHLYNEGIENAIPFFIKELSDIDSIIQPEIFRELEAYLASYPGDFQKLLEFKIKQRKLSETTLMLAVMAENMQYVEKLVEEQSFEDSIAVNLVGKNALDLAIAKRHVEIINKLIDSGAIIGEGTIKEAVRTEQIDLVEQLLKSDPIFIDNILLYSMEIQNIDIIQRILDCQPGPSQRAKDRALGSISSNSTEVAKLLIDHGAKINNTKSGISPLMSAIQAGNKPLAEFLISQGASVASVTRLGTPLFYAALFARNDVSQGGIVQLLIDNGVDIHDPLMFGFMYKIRLMSGLRDNNPECASYNTLYLSSDGKYVTRDEYGLLYVDSLPSDSGVDLNEFENKLDDPDFKRTILNIISNRGHTTPSTLLHELIENNYIDIVKNLIAMGSDLKTFTPRYGETPLSIAVKAGHLEIIRAIIDKDPSLVNYPNKNGQFPLQIAIVANKMDVVEELISDNANLDVHLKDSNGKSALYYAIKQGNVELAQKLIAKGALAQSDDELSSLCLFAAIVGGNHFNDISLALIDILNANNIDSTDENGSTALLWAAQTGNTVIFSKLIEKGANIQHANKEGWNAIFYAADYNQMDIFEIIKENDPDFRTRLNHKSEDNVTALYVVIDNEDTDAAFKLLEEGADPNIATGYGDTPLMYVQDPKLAVKLIDSGANINHQNKLGTTPLLSAVDDEQTDIAWTLLDAGADPNLASQNGNTPICVVQDAELAKALIQRGADPNHINKEGMSALQLAIYRKNYEVALILLNAGADPNILDSKGNSLLMYLAETKLIEALLEKGADIHHRNYKRESVLNAAIKAGLIDIVLILIKYADRMNLYDDLSEPTTIHHFNKLPSDHKQHILEKIRLKLTHDQFHSLQLVKASESRAKSVVFRDIKNRRKDGRVEKLIAEHEEKIKRSKPSRED